MTFAQPFVILLLLFGLMAQPILAADSNALAGSTQMVVVTTANWEAHTGLMRWFSRTNAGAVWHAVDEPYTIVVGRAGLAWGKGLNAVIEAADGPGKREGDGKSPAGIFRLSSAFGRDVASKIPGLKLPYQRLTSAIECVDDSKSAHYNSIVNRAKTSPVDWDSAEKMLGVGAEYQLGVVVDHNVDPRTSEGGSCIFLHVWKDNQTGTSGCTAMLQTNIYRLVGWLDPAAQPVLVQLPIANYHQLQKTLQLPNF